MKNQELQQKVGHEGVKPEIPLNFPIGMAKIVKLCWSTVPDERPKMREICFMLTKI